MTNVTGNVPIPPMPEGGKHSGHSKKADKRPKEEQKVNPRQTEVQKPGETKTRENLIKKVKKKKIKTKKSTIEAKMSWMIMNLTKLKSFLLTMGGIHLGGRKTFPLKKMDFGDLLPVIIWNAASCKCKSKGLHRMPDKVFQ